MAIQKITRFNIDCDTCELKYDWQQFDSLTDAVAVIRADGWGVKRGRGGTVQLVVCPEHNDFDNGQ